MLADVHGGGTLLAHHAGHLSLLLGWVAIFAVVVGRQKVKALGLTVVPLRPGVNTLSMAGCFVVAAGAQWVIIGEHVTAGPARIALVTLTMGQLLLAGLVAGRPSERLVRAVGTACLVIALWWVLGRGLAGPGSVLSLVDVLAFSAQLATAGCAWLVLSRTPVLSN